MNFTPLVGLYFASRQKAVEHYNNQAEQLQMNVMRRLVQKASQTEWGSTHHFGQIKSYEDFAKSMSVNSYEELKGYIDVCQIFRHYK